VGEGREENGREEVGKDGEDVGAEVWKVEGEGGEEEEGALLAAESKRCKVES
jgi:hypothetical protein